jgi:hypothetical protein
MSYTMDVQFCGELQSEFERDISQIKVPVSDVKLKMGNEIHGISLA